MFFERERDKKRVLPVLLDTLELADQKGLSGARVCCVWGLDGFNFVTGRRPNDQP
jgi:hypothetical protein